MRLFRIGVVGLVVVATLGGCLLDLGSGIPPYPPGESVGPVASPGPLHHMWLPDGKGSVYVINQTVFHEVPGQGARAIYELPQGVSFEYALADLSGLILHDRLWLYPDPPPPGKKSAASSRLILQPLPQGEPKVLIERFYNYSLQLEASPDGRRFVVSTQLDPDQPDAEGPYLLDIDTATLTPLAAEPGSRLLAWSPDSARLALLAAGGERLEVADASGAEPRLLHRFGNGVRVEAAAWLKDSKRLVTMHRLSKDDERPTLLMHSLDGGAATQWSIDPAGEARIEFGLPSPSGGQLFGRRISGQETQPIIIDLESRTWRPLADGEMGSGWNGSVPLCGWPGSQKPCVGATS